MENNKKLADELVELFVKGEKEKFEEKTLEYINQLSYNIGMAVNPVNEIVLPFIIFALKTYVDGLKKGREEYVDGVVKELEDGSKTAVITIPSARGEDKER
jgi:hypothetical protein